MFYGHIYTTIYFMITNLNSDPELRFRESAQSALRLSVIVPAKNEAEYISSTLDALRLQCDELGNPVSYDLYEVLVLANNCSDETYEICKQYQIKYPRFRMYVQCMEIPQPIAHIGTVRRLLMDAAYHRLVSVAGERGIIVSTDADSEVDPYWVHHILAEMDKGVDVVGGRILPRDTPALSKIHHLRDVTYRFLRSKLESELDPCALNPWPRHFQCYGPSLAVTCEMYEKAGKLPMIPFLEDEEFRKALKRVDARIRHSPKVRIYTSSRLEGRVGFGFSVQLQQWSDMSLKAEQQCVESLETVTFQLSLKNELRKLWTAVREGREVIIELKSIAFKIHFNADDLYSIIRHGVYFEPVWEQIYDNVVQKSPALLHVEPISEAIQRLRQYFSFSGHAEIPAALEKQTPIAV